MDFRAENSLMDVNNMLHVYTKALGGMKSLPKVHLIAPISRIFLRLSDLSHLFYPTNSVLLIIFQKSTYYQ
jgi:hypothetical protein